MKKLGKWTRKLLRIIGRFLMALGREPRKPWQLIIRQLSDNEVRQVALDDITRLDKEGAYLDSILQKQDAGVAFTAEEKQYINTFK